MGLGNRKPDVIERKDGRIELRGMAYTKMRTRLRELAGNRCEECGRFDMNGDAHHGKGRGAGKRDDRIFVDGKRNLFYLCRGCRRGDVEETLEQAVKRIAKKYDMDDRVDEPSGRCLSCSQFEAALREMAAFQRERDAEIAERWSDDDSRAAQRQSESIAAAIRKGE